MILDNLIEQTVDSFLNVFMVLNEFEKTIKK